MMSRRPTYSLGARMLLAATVLLLFTGCGAASDTGATSSIATQAPALAQSSTVTPSNMHPSPTPPPTILPASTWTLAPTPRPPAAHARATAPITLVRVAPTATSRPTQPAAPPASALAVVFTCAQAVDHSHGQICVHTSPGAALTIIVRYCTGYPAVSHSLRGISYADGAGNHTWSWTPDTKCPGTAVATVTATLRGASVTATSSFIVR